MRHFCTPLILPPFTANGGTALVTECFETVASSNTGKDTLQWAKVSLKWRLSAELALDNATWPYRIIQ